MNASATMSSDAPVAPVPGLLVSGELYCIQCSLLRGIEEATHAGVLAVDCYSSRSAKEQSSW